MADLDEITVAALGDSITYRTAGGSAAAIKAFVDYRDALKDLGANNVIVQDFSVQVLISDVPAKPDANCRVTLGRIPGRTFKPINARRTESGTLWEFEVSQVNG